MGAGGRGEVADDGELEVAVEGDADERAAARLPASHHRHPDPAPSGPADVLWQPGAVDRAPADAEREDELATPPPPDFLDRLSALDLTRLSRRAGLVAAVLAVVVGVGLGLRHAVDHRAADRLAASLAAANQLDANAQAIQHTMAAEGTATDGPLLDATVAELDDQEAERLVSLATQAEAATVVDDARLYRLRADAAAYLAAWAKNLRAVASFARAHPGAFASPPYGPVGSPTLGPTLGPPPNTTVPDPPAPQTGPTVRLGATTTTLADAVASAWGIPTAALDVLDTSTSGPAATGTSDGTGGTGAGSGTAGGAGMRLALEALGPVARSDVTLTAADRALALLARPLDTPSADIPVVAGGGNGSGSGGLAFVPLAGTAARSATLPVIAAVTAPSPATTAASSEAGVTTSTAPTSTAQSPAVGATGSSVSLGSSEPGTAAVAEVLRLGRWLALGVPASDGGLEVLGVPAPSAATVARLARAARAGRPAALGGVTAVTSFPASETEIPTEKIGGMLGQPVGIAPGPRPGSVWVVGTNRAEALGAGGRAVLPAAPVPDQHLAATFTGLAAGPELLVWNDVLAGAADFSGQLARFDPASGRVALISASDQTGVYQGQVTETYCGLPLAASATTFFWENSLGCTQSPTSFRLEETNAATGVTRALPLAPEDTSTVAGGAASAPSPGTASAPVAGMASGQPGSTTGLLPGTQLTTDFGAVSPNGKLLAIALQGSAHAWNGTPVWTLGIVDLATGRVQVVPGATIAPVPAQPFAWAPDGKRLFFQTDDVNAGLATWELGAASAVDIRGTASLAPPLSQPSAPVNSEADLYAVGSARQGELAVLGPGD